MVQNKRRQKFERLLNEVDNTKGIYMLKAENDYYHFFSFIYRGFRIYVQENEGAIDENHPGDVIFSIYRITVDGCSQTQVTYFENFEGLFSVDAVIDAGKFECEAHIIPINIGMIGVKEKSIIEKVLAKDGGEREKEVWNNAHFCVVGDTWNNDHHVVDILKISPEEDGYFGGFSVDLLTKSICG